MLIIKKDYPFFKPIKIYYGASRLNQQDKLALLRNPKSLEITNCGFKPFDKAIPATFVLETPIECTNDDSISDAASKTCTLH